MKVLLNWFANAEEVNRIKAALPKGTEIFAPPERPHLSRFEVGMKDIEGAVDGADAAMGWVAPPGFFERAKKLKSLVWLHAGVDELDLQMLKRRGIQVANVRGGNAISVAEHAITLMLAIAKRLVIKHQAVLNAHWEPMGHMRPEYVGVVVEGKTVAVVGLGQVGMGVAKKAKGLDMRVIGVRRHPERGGAPFLDAVYGPKDLHKVLAEADFVVLCTPITGETAGFIDEEALARMKPSAFLINSARGNLIQELPLYQALTQGRLAGFASDVWWNYTNSLPPTYHFPIPSRTGLQRLPNVIATGSQAGVAIPGVIDRLIALGTESLAAFVRGQPAPRMISLDLGY